MYNNVLKCLKLYKKSKNVQKNPENVLKYPENVQKVYRKCPKNVKNYQKQPNKCGYIIYGCPPSFTFGSKL